MGTIPGLYEELQALIAKYAADTDTTAGTPAPTQLTAESAARETAPEPKQQITFEGGEYHGV